MAASLPGSPAVIQQVAGAWRDAADRLAESRSAARQAQLDEWHGESADAYRAAGRQLIESLTTTSERLAAGARILASYADYLAGAEERHAAARQRIDSATMRLRQNPLDVAAGLEATAARIASFVQTSQAQAAANAAATELLALLGTDDSWGQNWWDPFGLWDDHSKPDTRVDEDTLDETNWDPAFVQQGSIGDCYALSTLMGYMRTEDGRELLQSNVRWDDDKHGYWVTLYSQGKPTEYFVDNVYGQGVNQYDGTTLWWENTSPSIVSVYEAALAQQTSFSDINDGGQASQAIEAITGRRSQMVEFGWRTDDDRVAMSEALASGSAVVASSQPGQGTFDVDNVTILRPDGTTEVANIEIARSHAYEVEKVESDGSVWVRNPHGPGNTIDGGGLIHLTQEQFDNAFWRAAYEETS